MIILRNYIYFNKCIYSPFYDCNMITNLTITQYNNYIYKLYDIAGLIFNLYSPVALCML